MQEIIIAQRQRMGRVVPVKYAIAKNDVTNKIAVRIAQNNALLPKIQKTIKKISHNQYLHSFAG